MEPGLVFASSDPVTTESFALAILKYLRNSLSVLYGRILLLSNNNTKKIDNTPLEDHPYIRHSLELGLGKMASEIAYKNVPVDLQRILEDMLISH